MSHRIGLLSDSHGQSHRTGLAVKLLVEAGADLLIHLGDIEQMDVIDSLIHELDGQGHVHPPVHMVFGNVDWNSDELGRYATALGMKVDHPVGTLKLAGRRLIFQHGHDTRQMQIALTQGADYLMHGHTHKKRDERIGRTRLINPGALQRASEYTVALLDLKTDDLRFLTVAEQPKPEIIT